MFQCVNAVQSTRFEWRIIIRTFSLFFCLLHQNANRYTVSREIIGEFPLCKMPGTFVNVETRCYFCVRIKSILLSSMFINLRRIEVFADKGYDSKNNNKKCYDMGFQPRIMRRRCKNSKRQNGKRVHVEHTFAWLDNFRRLRLQYEVSPVVHIAYSSVSKLNPTYFSSPFLE